MSRSVIACVHRLLAGALMSGLALLLTPSEAAAAVERFAVVIGNNRGDSDDVPLRYAVDDAKRVRDVLRDIGGFEPINTVLLEDEDASTVRSTLIGLNERIRGRVGQAGVQVMLFVYYSGHADAEQLHLGHSALPMRELSGLITGSAAQFRIAVIDACRSGVMTRAKGGRLVAPFPLATEESLPGQGLAFLTASALDEDAQESDQLRGSFFTHALVSGLLGAADGNRDGQVALDEAYRYAYASTLRSTSRTLAGTQHPTFRYDFRGQGDLILTRPAAHAHERALLNAPTTMDVLFMAGSEHGAVVAEVGRTVSVRTVSLRPGRYFVRVRGTDVLYEGTIDAAAGSSSGIDVGQLDRVEYARLVRKGNGELHVAHALEAGARLRTALPNAETPCIGAFVGYALDLHHLGMRARLSGCTSGADNASVDSTSNAYDLELRVHHAWDMAPLTFELGLGGGATWFHQSFDTRGEAAARNSVLPFLAVGAAAALDLGGAYYAALDLNAETHLMRIDDHDGQGARTQAGFALRTSLALGRRF